MRETIFLKLILNFLQLCISDLKTSLKILLTLKVVKSDQKTIILLRKVKSTSLIHSLFNNVL